jgi:hypothetical protein
LNGGTTPQWVYIVRSRWIGDMWASGNILSYAAMPRSPFSLCLLLLYDQLMPTLFLNYSSALALYLQKIVRSDTAAGAAAGYWEGNVRSEECDVLARWAKKPSTAVSEPEWVTE